MLSSSRYPHMNRAARRHPAKYERSLWPTTQDGVSALFLTLMVSGGFMQPEQGQVEAPRVPAITPPLPPSRKAPLLQRIKAWAGRLFK